MQTALRTLYKGRWGYAFIAPSFALFALFFLVPVVWGRTELLDYQVFRQTFVGSRNYRESSKPRVLVGVEEHGALYAGDCSAVAGRAPHISALIFPLAKPIQTFFKGAFYLRT